MRVKCHPTLGILVGTDGHVMVPQNYRSPAHWTFGCKNGSTGYRQVGIATKIYHVHRLVVETFIGEIPDGMEVDHIDRDRSNNALNNLRIVTSSINHRNTSAHDRVTERGGTHKYEDARKSNCDNSLRYYYENWEKVRKCQARYRAENKDKIREQRARRRKMYKCVLFSDGKRRDIPNSEALELLKLPVKERTWPI